MRRKVRSMLFICAPIVALVLASGCVSKSSYVELEQKMIRAEEENQRLRRDLISQKQEYDSVNADKKMLEHKLSTREMRNIGELESKVASCEKRIQEQVNACEKITKEARDGGWYEGAAAFNSSLKVSGYPTTRGWWIFSSHYYEFQVILRGEKIFSFVVETESEQPPLDQGLALVSELNKWRRLAG